jgi:putative oxidoreductase
LLSALRALVLSESRKFRSCDDTVYLFSNENPVSVWPSAVVAVIASGGELIFPMLPRGCQGRFAATGLFVVELVAIATYPGSEVMTINDQVRCAIADLFSGGVGSRASGACSTNVD